ncbi:MAG: thioredoxin [Rhodospirillales bacterium]|nr:thioredoxin [Rhodospirillales bacterium]
MAFIIDPNRPQPPAAQKPAQDATPAPAAPGDIIKDTTVAQFKTDVIETSMKVPVIVDFWAPWCGPCKQLGPMLERLVRQANGLVRLVKINVDENQQLAAQMQVASIPTVYAFRNGQPVDGFQGAVPESQLRQFIDRLLGGAKPPLDQAVDEAKALLDAGNARDAAQIFEQALAEDAGNPGAASGLIRAALALGDTARAKQVVDGLSADLKAKPEIAAAISALELKEQTKGAGDLEELRAKLAQNPNDHQARFDLALALYAAGDAEAAVKELLELVRRDRKWNDEAARKQLVKIFAAAGPVSPVTVQGRRQLSSILFS